MTYALYSFQLSVPPLFLYKYRPSLLSSLTTCKLHLFLQLHCQLTDMVAGSFADEKVCHVAPARLWKAMVLDTHNLVPKLLPEIVARVDILEGDGGVGTVKKVTFGPAVKEFTCLKERIDVIDHENYVYKYTVLEGGLLGIKLKAYTFEVKVEATEDGAGAKRKLKVDYDSLREGVFGEEDIEKIIGGLGAIVKALEGYLIQNPDAYT